MRPILLRLLAPAALALLTACGGGSGSPAAPAPPAIAASLDYTDPQGSGWRLVKSATSSPTQLVLDLVGPEGLKTRGVGFNLQSDGRIAFVLAPGGTYLEDLGVFQLRSLDVPAGSYDSVVAIGGLLRQGKVLSAALFQKDRRQSAQAVNLPLCRVRIALDGTQALPKDTEIALSVIKARVIPEDIGVMPPNPDRFDSDFTSVIQKSRLVPIDIAVGKLVLR